MPANNSLNGRTVHPRACGDHHERSIEDIELTFFDEEDGKAVFHRDRFQLRQDRLHAFVLL